MTERDDRRERIRKYVDYPQHEFESDSVRDDVEAELEASERDRAVLGRMTEAAYEVVRGHESRFCDLALCSRCYLQSELGAMVVGGLTNEQT